MSKIAVIGSFVMDLVGMVDEFPLEGQTVIGNAFHTMPGGKRANQAVAAARLGANVEMFGRVGNDAYGEMFLNLFSEEGIDTSTVKKLDGYSTAVGLIQINRQAENKIVVIPGANFGYLIEDADRDSARYLSADFAVLQLELEQTVTYEIIKKCEAAGIPVMLNPAPAVRIPQEILSKVTYLTPNETEIEILTGMKVDTNDEVKAAVDLLLEMGVKNVIATLGKRGAYIGNAEMSTFIQGYEVDPVDTVAAGDSFNGALAYGLSIGNTLPEAVKYANAVGALTVTKQGAIPSLPTAHVVKRFLEEKATQ